jgi:hypothetical protein
MCKPRPTVFRIRRPYSWHFAAAGLRRVTRQIGDNVLWGEEAVQPKWRIYFLVAALVANGRAYS